MNADADSIEQLERLLVSEPGGTIILAHCGIFAGADVIRRMLERHANLHCDLAVRGGRQRAGPVFKSVTPTGSTLEPSWKKLIQDYSDRFLVGTDSLDQDLRDYGDIIAWYRAVLAQLNADAARRIAYENAQRLYHLPKAEPAPAPDSSRR